MSKQPTRLAAVQLEDGTVLHVVIVPTDKRPRVYFQPSHESMLENLMRRHSRPVTAWRALLPEALRVVEAALGLGLRTSDTSARWSQKAGCRCGCSPGFVLRSSVLQSWDIHVEVEVADRVDSSQESFLAMAEAAR